MGIRGLGKFMCQNKVLEPFCLRDTRVIVDGKNLCHKLMRNSGRGNLYGGNYDIFSNHIELFFSQLKRFQIFPHVVLDGAYDPDDKKFRCLLERCNMKISELVRGNVEGHFPILAHRTFIQTLNKLQVPVVTCPYEADREIAVLAKHWKCPVLSDDNDFYVFDLPGGVIRFSDLSNSTLYDTNTCNRKTHADTMIYYSKNIKTALGFCPSMLPLLALLNHNDYFLLKKRTIELFIKNVTGKQQVLIRHNSMKQLQSVLETLCYLKDLSEGIGALKHCLHSDSVLSVDEKNETLAYVDIIVQYFRIESSECRKEYKFDDVGRASDLASTGLPVWLLESIKSCQVSPLIVNAANGKVILKPNLEDLTQPYFQNIASLLRQTIYKMALEQKPNQRYVTEYYRTHLSISQARIYPAVGLDDFMKLDEILEADLTSREKCIASIFQMIPEDLVQIHEYSKLFVMCLNFFTKNSYLKDSMKGQKCLLLCHMLLLWKETGLIHGIRTENEEINNVISFFVCENKELTFDIQIIHELQRFQAVIDVAYDINGILRFPVRPASPSVMFNGSLMYSLFTQTENEARLDRIIELCLGTDSELRKSFTKMLSVINGSSMSLMK